MKLVTFHTDSKYRQMAQEMLFTAETFGIVGESVGCEDRGSWVANVNYKPAVILGALRRWREPILYVDADARFRAYPQSLDTVERLGAAYHTAGRPTGGTLYFRPEADVLLEVWLALVEKSPKKADDFVNLNEALRLFGAKLHHLEPSYCWHEKNMRCHFPGAVPVIEHFCVGDHTYETV